MRPSMSQEGIRELLCATRATVGEVLDALETGGQTPDELSSVWCHAAIVHAEIEAILSLITAYSLDR